MEQFSELLRLGIVNTYYPLDGTAAIIGTVAVIIAGYILGSLNFALIISKIFFKDDIREHGSGNAGMTNMQRTFGNKAAVVTLFGDAAKTALATFVGAIILGSNLFPRVNEASEYVETIGFAGMYLGGMAAVIGHCFPVFYGFKGGKGVVCAATMILCTDPIAFLILFAIFAIIVLGTKFISLGSVMGMLIYPLILSRFHGKGIHIIFALVVVIIIVAKHHANIKRLRKGEENKLELFKKKI
ncbi:glycerol-3-phosphate acyltransferase [Clostridia bacterium]|nr:glycerol-3-phosphate acyltransferase [Clostridia bacterium]